MSRADEQCKYNIKNKKNCQYIFCFLGFNNEHV